MGSLQQFWQDPIVQQIVIPAVTALVTAGLTAFITSAATSTIAALFYGTKIKADLRKEYESRLNTQRWEVYREFATWFGTISSYIVVGERLPKDARADLLRHIHALALVSSPEVVHILSRFLNAKLRFPSTDTVDMFLSDWFPALLNAMRRDLGYDPVDWGVSVR